MTNVAERPGAPPDAAAIQHLLQLGTGFIVSSALGVAARLGVADHLAGGPRPVADLAAAAGAHEESLYRVLRALSMVGVFAETAPRTFALTPVGTYLRAGVPGSVRDMVIWLCDAFHFRLYAEMGHSVQTGETADRNVLGVRVFEYFERDRELSERFNNAMTAFSASVVPAVLDAYDFSGIRLLVDVAGGHGMVLGSILRKYPEMRGILFDVDHVLAGATQIEAMGVEHRCRKVSGDFFTAVPAGGDAYLMKHIIHDWDDEKASTILRNIHAALEGKRDGRVILLEAVIRPGNEPDLAKLIDLEMLLGPGGRERTEEQFAALFARSGFELTGIVPTASPLSVIEARAR